MATEHAADELSPSDSAAPLSRRAALRQVLKAALVVGAGGAARGQAPARGGDAHAPDPAGEETVRRLPAIESLPAEGRRDPLVQMQRDLARAMAKPLEQRHWVMVIDRRKCVGCHACTIGCIAENNLPPGVVYRPVYIEESGAYPGVVVRSRPRPCMHCDRPPCVEPCPVDATWKRADGAVVIDYDRCIGCGQCVDACPYGARSLDEGKYYTAELAQGAPEGAVMGPGAPYESRANHEYGKAWSRAGEEPPVGKARKCHFCLHRLEVGQLPMCASTCIGRATYFGDSSDPDSLVAHVLAENQVQVYLPERGTQPRVFYID